MNESANNNWEPPTKTGGRMTDDPELAATTFIVLDFEGTTPTGRPPEPIEVAAVGLRYREGSWQLTARFEALMRPPVHAPVTAFDIVQTGITAQMVADQPSAAEVLARLDTRLTCPPYLLVAHNAPTEAGMVYRYRDACPTLASTHLLDTVRLARHVLPGLPHGYGLDALLRHLAIPRPKNRHRAMPDVEATIAVFCRLIDEACSLGEPSSVQGLMSLAGYQAKATRPVQESIF